MKARDILEQIAFAHRYTMRLLDATPRADWGRVPAAGVSHIAWQVGHLAMAGHRLAMDRIRGQRPGDEDVVGQVIVARYGRDSKADPVTAAEAEAAFGAYLRVHAHIQVELASLPDAELDQPIVKPHSLCRTKREILLWCVAHEMLHAGQVGLLRRQLGHPAVW